MHMDPHNAGKISTKRLIPDFNNILIILKNMAYWELFEQNSLIFNNAVVSLYK